MTTHDPKLLNKGMLAVRRNAIRNLLTTVFGIERCATASSA
jgi:ATP-dependent DNA helicase RecQ